MFLQLGTWLRCVIRDRIFFGAPVSVTGVGGAPDCSSDHRCSPVAEHGGRCPCCAVSRILPVDTEADVPVVLVVRVHRCRLHLVRKLVAGSP